MVMVVVDWVLISSIELRLLLFDIRVGGSEVHLLVNSYIHLFDQQTISRHTVSLMEVDDISNHQVLN